MWYDWYSNAGCSRWTVSKNQTFRDTCRRTMISTVSLPKNTWNISNLKMSPWTVPYVSSFTPSNWPERARSVIAFSSIFHAAFSSAILIALPLRLTIITTILIYLLRNFLKRSVPWPSHIHFSHLNNQSDVSGIDMVNYPNMVIHHLHAVIMALYCPRLG